MQPDFEVAAFLRMSKHALLVLVSMNVFTYLRRKVKNKNNISRLDARGTRRGAVRFTKYSRGNRAARVSNRVRGRVRCAVDISTPEAFRFAKLE